MKVRYTDPATDELEQSISYFREHAPSFVVDFVDSIDDAVVWKIVQQDLPPLKQQVESMLAAAGSS